MSLRWFVLLFVWCCSPAVFAAGGSGGYPLEAAHLSLDAASLQRGARTFVNYCLSCHSASSVRYSALSKLGLSVEQISDNLMLSSNKVYGRMLSSMRPEDAQNWLGAPAPDLSLVARVKGVDWLYSYLQAFYRDDTQRSGWNNALFDQVAMPHVLSSLQAPRALTIIDVVEDSDADGQFLWKETHFSSDGVRTEKPPRIASRRDLFAIGGHAGRIFKWEGEVGAAYDQTVQDLVSFLQFIARPEQRQSKILGVIVLMVLGLLFLLAWLLKREYWKDIH